MSSAGRFSLLSTIGVVTFLFSNQGLAETKFATDDVAETAKKEEIAEVLSTRSEMDQALAAQDPELWAAFLADDLIVNTPGNRVGRKQDVLGFLKAGLINYEDADTTIEAFDSRDDEVVIMGEEVVKPKDATANAGKTVRRRLTDVWRKESDGKWRLTIRQATITSVE